MFARLGTAVLALVIASTAGLSAAQPPAQVPSPSPKAQGAEVAFVSGVQKDLMARFPTAADAEKAGYFRFTNEDNTGSISYVNLQWASADPRHPSQLWYDVNGKLLGADYSELQSASPSAPKLWGVNPSRWTTFHAHMHYVAAGPNGAATYGGLSAAKFTAAGGDINDPKAETLVKMGKIKDASQVTHVFLFPAIWDLQVWVKPNPNGAFAEMNPLVTPSKDAEKDSE